MRAKLEAVVLDSMAGWDERFASIMQETERSLARVKSQLRNPATKRQAPSLTNSDRKSAVQRLPPPPPGPQHHHGSPSFVSLLSGRIHEQQKVISTLQDTVDLLQSTVQEQNQRIGALRDEVALIQRSLLERQVDETKIKQFKTEVSHELEVLRRDHRRHTSTPEVSPSLGNSLTVIAQELHSSKHMLNEEIDSLQRDLTLMRSRQVNHESEVTTWSSIIRDLERRQERLARALSSLQDWQRTECRKNDHLDGNDHKVQMSHLLATLDHRISSLEQALLQTFTKSPDSLGGLDTPTHRNPLHPDTTTRARRRRRSDSEASLHLSLDASHDVVSDSDGELSAGMLLDDSSSISSLDSTT